MKKNCSSATGEGAQKLIINHTECDSVLANVIPAGELPLKRRFGRAPIAANYSGQTSAISDLL